MKYLRKIFDNKMVVYLFLVSPIIDVITGIMASNGFTITIGMIIKVFQLFLACGYIVFCDKSNVKKNGIYILLLLIFCCLNIINNKDILNSNLVEYLNYIFKFNYFAIMILYFYRYLHKNPNINIRILSIPIIIFTLFILLSNITGTAFPTYIGRLGTSSWYFSSNEYSANLCILYPLVIYIFMDRVKLNILNGFIFLIFTYGILSCGTKATLISFYGCMLVYILYKLLKIKKEKLNFSFTICLIILISACLFYKELPTVKNVGIHLANVENSGITENNDKFRKIFFSNRDIFLKRIESYGRTTEDKLVGKAYLFEGHIDIIESDIFDIYYTYGVIGFVLIYGLFFYLLGKQIIYYFKNIRNTFFDSKYTLSLLSSGLVLVTSLIAGHTITSPSVAVFAAFIISKINVFKDARCNGESILYVYDLNNLMGKIIEEHVIDKVLFVEGKNNDIPNSSILSKYNTIIGKKVTVIFEVFMYFTGKTKYNNSYMIYSEKNGYYFNKLCYISSMNSVLLIKKADYDKLSNIDKYKLENDNFQKIEFIEE